MSVTPSLQTHRRRRTQAICPLVIRDPGITSDYLRPTRASGRATWWIAGSAHHLIVNGSMIYRRHHAPPTSTKRPRSTLAVTRTAAQPIRTEASPSIGRSPCQDKPHVRRCGTRYLPATRQAATRKSYCQAHERTRNGAHAKHILIETPLVIPDPPGIIAPPSTTATRPTRSRRPTIPMTVPHGGRER
jgi:hypothetical protein